MHPTPRGGRPTTGHGRGPPPTLPMTRLPHFCAGFLSASFLFATIASLLAYHRLLLLPTHPPPCGVPAPPGGGRTGAGVAAADRTSAADDDYAPARRDSYGFFDDVPSSEWSRLRTIARDVVAAQRRQQRGDLAADVPKKQRSVPSEWYQLNWEPNFSCRFERRVGGLGDGPKWVCDPDRIPEVAAEQGRGRGEETKPRKQQEEERGTAGEDGNAPCLVYSVGSAGNFMFERGVKDTIGPNACEVHIFDPEDFSRTKNYIAHFGGENSRTRFHQWGFVGSGPNAGEIARQVYPQNKDLASRFTFRTLQQTMDLLNHTGRTIDILKIDCEGCEWDSYQDWIDAGPRQILIETHAVPSSANGLFGSLHEAGYVIFHKEPNTVGCRGDCVEFGFLKLMPEF